MQTTSHETERERLIRSGPNMQRRADVVGNQLVEVLSKQAEAMTLSLKLYEMYRVECQQQKMSPVGVRELYSLLRQREQTTVTG